MKNNRILSVVIMSFILANSSFIVTMESSASTSRSTKGYNGSLSEDQALKKALNESRKEAERVNKSSREQIAQDAALAQRLQRQTVAQQQQTHNPASSRVKPQNVRTNQRFVQNNQTQKKQAHTSGVQDLVDNIQLPRDLENKHLTHLVVSRQNDSTSCGYHATFNAWALQELITREIPIASEYLQQLAMQHHRLILPDHLLEIGHSANPQKPDYILELAQRIGLTDNVYFLNYTAKGNAINGKIFDAAGVRDNLNHSYVEFLETIRLRDDEGVLVGHIICNYNNGHWTTFSVVKKSNQVPEIYYMNSTNASLKVDSSAYAVAKRILELVG